MTTGNGDDPGRHLLPGYVPAPGALAADPERVRPLTEHMLRAFEQYMNEVAPEAGVPYIDGLMAAHNFHKQIVLDMIERAGLEGAGDESAIMLLRMMRDTFSEAMNREISKRLEG